MKHLKILGLALVFCNVVHADNHNALTADDRVSMALMVYNRNFAVITDQRRATLTADDDHIEITDVVKTIQPETVSLRSDKEGGFVARSQKYRYDLLNRSALLERFVGRKIKYSRFLLDKGAFEKVLREGVLLSINPEIVMFGDIIEIQPEGTISLPSLPSDLTLSPTLVFHGANQSEGTQDLLLRYMATGLSWTADYSLTLSDKAKLEGWVSVRNQSSSDLSADRLSLVAGDVAKQVPSQRQQKMVMMQEMAADSGPAASPVSGGDYHRYDFDEPVQLSKNDLTQLRLIDRNEIRFEKIYRKISHVNRYRADASEEGSPDVVLRFSNTRKNKLGVPLPAGVVRVFETKAGTEDFIGESRIPHRAEGSQIELTTGAAFDLNVRRAQKAFRRITERRAEVTYEVTLSNASEKNAVVELHEKLAASWEVISASLKSSKPDSQTLVFAVDVPAKGKATVEYRVRLDW